MSLNPRVLAALACTQYKPGDEGFEVLAAKCTPLDRIRKGFSQGHNNITAAQGTSARIRRNENKTELWGGDK